MLVRIAEGGIIIRLLLQRQSDLGLHCSSRSYLTGNLVFEIKNSLSV